MSSISYWKVYAAILIQHFVNLQEEHNDIKILIDRMYFSRQPKDQLNPDCLGLYLKI